MAAGGAQDHTLGRQTRIGSTRGRGRPVHRRRFRILFLEGSVVPDPVRAVTSRRPRCCVGQRMERMQACPLYVQYEYEYE